MSGGQDFSRRPDLYERRQPHHEFIHAQGAKGAVATAEGIISPWRLPPSCVQGFSLSAYDPDDPCCPLAGAGNG